MPSLPPSQEPARPLTVRLMTGWMALKFAKLNVTLPILLFFGACQVPSRPRGLPLHCVSSMICSHGNAPSVQTTFAVATTGFFLRAMKPPGPARLPSTLLSSVPCRAAKPTGPARWPSKKASAQDSKKA